MRYLILSDIHANIDAFDAVLEHAVGPMGSRPGARRSRRLRRRAQRGRRSRQRAAARGGDPRQPRQGGLRDRRRQPVQSRGAHGGDVDRRAADAGQPRLPPRAADGARCRSTRSPRSATARRSTRITTSSTATTPHMALQAASAPALPLRPHPPAGDVQTSVGRIIVRRGRRRIPTARPSSRCSGARAT